MEQDITSPTAAELRSALSHAQAVTMDCGLAFVEVDAIIDVAPETFRRMCQDPPSDHPAEGRLRMLVDALECAAGVLGGRVAAAMWLRTPHSLMGGNAPIGFLAAHPETLRPMRDALRDQLRRLGAAPGAHTQGS